MSKTPTFKRILITRPFPFVTNVQLNRPEKRNAFDDIFWKEIGEAFNFLATDSDTRIDLNSSNDLLNPENNEDEENDGQDFARKARKMREKILFFQNSLQSIDSCPKPVIAAIQKACFGGGVDIIAACDIRVAVENTLFSEVDIGLAADVGSLNRLPKICGNNSWIREISFTARTFDAKEALQHNLLSKLYATQEIMKSEVEKLAQIIASKSPVAVEGTKIILNYSRDHPVQDSLQFTANWNMSQLFTDDVPKSAMASFQKKELPKFSKL
uniref:Enoyl-CoA hydratase/isomerase family protein n=1 Tax=Panagrolaimus sp. PS1159 TaxID=55785 RepID=A0AC35F581_9BILA